MNPDIHLVTRLQDIDRRISELDKEIAALPKHVAQIEKALDSHLRKLEADRAALTANQKERKKLEGDIQIPQQKISKLRDQMLQAKTNDQYRAFQNEISFCEQEIRKAEDRILDLMSESEPLDANVKKAEGALKEEQKLVDAEKKRAQDRTAADKTEVAKFQQDRAGVVAEAKPATLSVYERARKKWHGHAVANVVEGRCNGCQILLRPQFFQELRKGDKIMQCESCGRILYWVAPSEGSRVDMSATPAPSAK